MKGALYYKLLIIEINLSYFPEQLKPLFMKSLFDGINNSSNRHNNIIGINSSSTLKIEYQSTLSEFKYIIEKLLEKNSIFDYIVAEDLQYDNTLVILKDGDLEQLGIQICDFCGALFNSEDEKYIHQKVHYMI